MPLHLTMRPGGDELLSLALDGVVLWDASKLTRKRSLGNGPYGAVHAAYTHDGSSMVTSFQVRRKAMQRVCLCRLCIAFRPHGMCPVHMHARIFIREAVLW